MAVTQYLRGRAPSVQHPERDDSFAQSFVTLSTISERFSIRGSGLGD
jgi:hypothetical protein